jgi:hypothetical protein
MWPTPPERIFRRGRSHRKDLLALPVQGLHRHQSQPNKEDIPTPIERSTQHLGGRGSGPTSQVLLRILNHMSTFRNLLLLLVMIFMAAGAIASTTPDANVSTDVLTAPVLVPCEVGAQALDSTRPGNTTRTVQKPSTLGREQHVLGPFPFPDTRCCRDTKRKDCMTPCAVPPSDSRQWYRETSTPGTHMKTNRPISNPAGESPAYPKRE